MTPTLRAHHLDDLRRSGLSDATIAALGFYSVTRQEAGKVLTFDPGSDCMAIPFPSVDGQKPFLRFKPDTPLTIPGQERAAKYLSPKGADNRLYIPPATRSLLQNADAAIIITEGEKKGAKADQEGFACVGLTGVECWRQKPRDAQGRKLDDADSVPIPDLDLVTWRKRTVFLVFDSDIIRKAEVRRALWALRGELVGRGAIVRVVYLPDGKDGAKVGLDDLLVAHGADALRKVLNDAPVLDWQERVRAVLDTPEGQGRDDLIRELLVDLMREGDALTRDRVRKALVDGKALTARTFDELAKECEPKGSGSSEPGQVELTAKRPDLVDLVDAGGNVAFLVKDGDALRVLSCVDSDGLRYIPPPREKIPFPLANADEVLRCYQSDTDGKLFDDLVSYHRAISDLPEGWYGLLATWDFHTWLLEPVHYSPIIVLYAVAGRGKSRTLQGAAYVACRAIITESLRDSYLGRYTDAWGGVVCFDVMNLWDKAKRMNSEDVILQRYERGAKVPRVNKPEAGAFMDTDFYNLFGGTIIATNEPLHHILDTRALTLIMTESSRRFPDDVMPEAGMPLRARLAAFRARHLGEHLPGTEKPISGRLGDITRPLVQMVRLVKREWESELLRLIRKLDSERKAEKRDTVDGEIVAALAECEGELMADGRLAVKAVTDNVNGARQEGQGKELTSQYIGKRLRALGFAGGQRTGEGKTILFDRDLLARLLDKYGIREDAHAPTETAQMAHMAERPAERQETASQARPPSAGTCTGSYCDHCRAKTRKAPKPSTEHEGWLELTCPSCKTVSYTKPEVRK